MTSPLSGLELGTIDFLASCEELFRQKHDRFNRQIEYEEKFPCGDASFFTYVKENFKRIEDMFLSGDMEGDEFIDKCRDLIVYTATWGASKCQKTV